jgi:polyisoprenyl-phosphate glycosyltransferase
MSTTSPTDAPAGVGLPRPDLPLISVVCPVYREEHGIDEFRRRLVAAMESIEPAARFEVIFVNDGSDDRSGEILRELCAADERLKLIDFSRNFGHQLAITAGMDAANGDACVVIDSDLQDPPEVIPRMVQAWREGGEVVYGQRSIRAGEPRLRLWAIKVFYRGINKLVDRPLPVDTGDFRLVDRTVLEVLQEMREENRYVRGLVSWVGFNQVAVRYDRDPRFAGTTNYPFTKLLKLAADGVTSFSERPLRLASGLGAMATVIGICLALWVIVSKLADPHKTFAGYASIMVAILFFGGVQLLCVGVLGEYVGRTYRESKGRPLYVVRERLNLPAAPRVGRDEAPRSMSPVTTSDHQTDHA